MYSLVKYKADKDEAYSVARNIRSMGFKAKVQTNGKKYGIYVNDLIKFKKKLKMIESGIR